MEKWRKILQDAVTDPDELAQMFGLNPEHLREVAKIFPFRIPRPYLALIRKKGDGIFRQCIPDIAELAPDSDLMDDPLGEERHKQIPGIVEKYPDRCLFLVSGQCAMYCRFCTRKRKFRGEFCIGKKQIDSGIAWIRKHKEVRDVLISGGDPLLLEDEQIDYILKGVRSAKHVEIIRIGSRVPCTLPERITPKLVSVLKKYHPLYINTHFNHPDELTPASVKALGRLADAGIPLGCQTVLLKGVNDDPGIMRSLMCRLLAARVKPYYLFLTDLVYGTEHFRTSIARGLEIIDSLRGWSSGMAVPHLAIDLPRGGGKVTLVPEHIVKREGKKITFRNYRGEEYIYPDV